MWANSFMVLYKPRFWFLAISMVFDYIFGFWGWGSFWALPQIYRDLHKPWNRKPTTIAVWSLKSTRLRGWWSSLVCMPWVCLLCQHVCQCASMPACQECASMPEGHPRSVWASQRSQRVPDVLKAKTLCHCARWLKIHKTVLMA